MVATNRSHVPQRPLPHRENSSGLENLMVKNINTLRSMRKAHAQLSAITLGAELRPPSPPPEPGQEPIQQKKPDRLRTSIPLDGGAVLAKARLTSRTSTVLEHTGFEGWYDPDSIGISLTNKRHYRYQQGSIRCTCGCHGRVCDEPWKDAEILLRQVFKDHVF